MGDVCVDDGYAGDTCSDQSRFVSGLRIEAETDLFARHLAQDCDAVIAFLPPEKTVVADVLEFIGGEFDVLNLSLLEA